jgi:hypothetical protein
VLVTLAGVIVWLGSWRWLGGACLAGAALVGLVGWWAEQGLAQAMAMDKSETIPTLVMAWLGELLGRLAAPVQTGAFALAAVGLVMLVGAALWPRRAPSTV